MRTFKDFDEFTTWVRSQRDEIVLAACWEPVTIGEITYTDFYVSWVDGKLNQIILQGAGEWLVNGLPVKCIAVHPTTGQRIVIRRNESGYCTAMDTDDGFNERNGITAAQIEAMLAGSIFGWDIPAADPSMYDDNGNIIKTHKRSA